MLNAQKYLTIVQSRGQRRLPLNRVYRGLRRPGLYVMAYMNLYANQGAMTVGTEATDTIDGMSLRRIKRVIHQVEAGSFRWKPVRRVYIAKANGKSRPLGIPGWTDKLVQEVIRLILNAYYEPRFSNHSHGFRPGRGCHTALQAIKSTWKGTKWFIEGDIRGCFDNIDHERLLNIIGRDIQDARLLHLLRGLLTCGYVESWRYQQTYSGTPQGGVLSPLLANIYLNELDHFVERELLLKWNQGKRRRCNPAYTRLNNREVRLKRKLHPADDEVEEIHRLGRDKRRLPWGDPQDPNYRRLRYVRYADDFLLGFVGTLGEAETIKEEIGLFLRETLKLEMSEHKTFITHATTQRARFLGYDIFMAKADSKRCHGQRSINGTPMLMVPRDVIQTWIRRYTKKGKPTHRHLLSDHSDYDIIKTYENELMGVTNYYALAMNVHLWYKVRYTVQQSLVKTLANKHKRSMKWVYRRFSYRPEEGTKGLRAIVERGEKKPLVATFGTRPIRYKRQSYLKDRISEPLTYTRRTELAQRLQAEQCELCACTVNSLEVHHIRKLADLDRYGRKPPPWVERMSSMRRKTLVVCRDCHNRIHAGRYDGKKIHGR